MSFTRFVYRSAKQIARCTPAWLIRIRPFAVLAIPTTRFLDRDDLPAGPPEEAIRWVGSLEEAGLLYGVADAENYAAWDAHSRRAAIVIREGSPIACVWVAAGEYHDPEIALTMTLADRDRWIYAAVVTPPHRGDGVYTRLLSFVGRELHREGVERIALGVVAGNERSLRAHLRWSPARLGGVLAARVLTVPWLRITGRLERVGHAQTGQSVAVVRIPPPAAKPTATAQPPGQTSDPEPAEPTNA
ncbi:Acetyltransferase (GNAT) family protein [Posidoniimonas polymericola]|uniref:Acetyltransferase (GNAT) family protein n=1 Tax=Posidoniimonas polymericola TaxID=2528002 RepID=A0A5C5YUV2_9BACT|nr:GNAT family N-acetyltransferase [Posidoniimonas polymericola]TWT78536.1 Acetyltransferase (GNAT) family protein [Posidoniimonas polymericola]